MAELGITAAQGRDGIKELLKIIASDADERLPADAHASLVVLAAELRAMQTLIGLIPANWIWRWAEGASNKVIAARRLGISVHTAKFGTLHSLLDKLDAVNGPSAPTPSRPQAQRLGAATRNQVINVASFRLRVNAVLPTTGQ